MLRLVASAGGNGSGVAGLLGDGTADQVSAAAASSALLSQVPLTAEDQATAGSTALFPRGAYDAEYQQQVDLRTSNSWKLKLDEVDMPELVEVMTINSMAPFVLNARLRRTLAAAMPAPAFVINVSAMEGQFYRFKTAAHPHTNSAKAALNMMTRTSASDYAQDGIFMCAVDTGWINDENPTPHAVQRALDTGFATPIDEVDAAARILDPVFATLAEGKDPAWTCGKFFKDYAVTEW